ncbi:methyltransferase [Nocardia sp. KC 131]|uniref:methyltransferase n=1 Tax=Nocardia arseniciresistens TaxID=3392119 RepID=UPI00398E7D2B
MPVVRFVEWFRGALTALNRKLAPPPIALFEMFTAAAGAQAVCAAAQLGIADALAAGPRGLSELAADIGADPGYLRRLMRWLISQGIFTQHPDQTYALTPLAEPLRTDAPVSLHSFARFIGSAQHRQYWSYLSDAVRNGTVVIPEAMGGLPFFDYVRKDREFGAIFDDAMTSISELMLEPMLAAGNFGQYGTIVDIGGGRGRLLAEILARAPETRGILFDLPEVVADVPVVDRCTVVAGSFFEAVPEGGDAYILKHIVHDWPDDLAEKILRTVHDAMTDSARLLLLEIVLPEGNRPHRGNFLDLEMMVSAGGRERTEHEFRELLAAAGFDLVRVIPTITPDSIVEARKVIDNTPPLPRRDLGEVE